MLINQSGKICKLVFYKLFNQLSFNSMWIFLQINIFEHLVELNKTV